MVQLRRVFAVTTACALVAACGAEPEGPVDAAAMTATVDVGSDVGSDVASDVGIDVVVAQGDVRDGSADARDVRDAITDVRDASADLSDAGAVTDAGGAPDAGPPSGVAPMGAVPGAVALRDGATTLRAMRGVEQVFRVEAGAEEHVQFHLRFAPPRAAVTLRVERWDGAALVPLGETDAGGGLRVLAVYDATGPRTFVARVRPGQDLSDVSLTLTRTPYRDGARCADDCARLLQLPLPNDPRRDGYGTDASTVFRYQYGRRDLVMFVRHAAQTMARMGAAPIIPQDLSQWDGATPGADTGSLRHASHQRGKDVDLSLYGADGLAPWRSYCAVTSVDGGRACVAGSVRGFAPAPNVALLADLYATGRVTMCFLDAELIAALRPAARAASLAPAVATAFTDGVHLQHWPNHDNHVHVRVSEGPTTGAGLVYEPFEAP